MLSPVCPTLDRVHWENIFEDLEGQLAAEWEAERAVLDAESERLRIAKLTFRTRLQRLQRADRDVTLRLADGTRRAVRLRAVGADWIAAHVIEAATTVIAPMTAVTSLETDHGALLEALDDAPVAPDSLRERMTLGFMLRDFGRRRIPLRLALSDGETLHGTVDRAGADHLDLAVHDAGTARRAANVRAFRMLPFDALIWVQPDGAAL
ncbi:hypothetical protein [Microbacterium sp.]|uniref:hypothetical protein n=1 Tax=Microbacterium sp. TaxID=51671 RepID=UPI002623F0C3|nr:hypothetical protein [Microbacterium sp.]